MTMRAWTQTPASTWHYTPAGVTQSYGYVLRPGHNGPQGEDRWAAIVKGPDLLDDVTLLEGSLVDAKRALEDQARGETGHAGRRRRWI